MDSVPLIISLLDKEYRSTTRKLNEIDHELRLLFLSMYSFLGDLSLIEMQFGFSKLSNFNQFHEEKLIYLFLYVFSLNSSSNFYF